MSKALSIEQIRAKLELQLASEGLAPIPEHTSKSNSGQEISIIRPEIDRFIQGDRKLNHLSDSSEPGFYTYSEAFYIKAQIIYTYWPYDNHSNKEYRLLKHCLKCLLELPGDTPNVHSLIRKTFRSKKKPSLNKVGIKIIKLSAWLLQFNFDSLDNWGPGTTIPNPVTYLTKRDNLASLSTRTYDKPISNQPGPCRTSSHKRRS